MKEKYYKINKDYAARAGLTADLREAIGNDLLLSEKDVKMISLTVEERVKTLGGVEFVKEGSATDTTEETAAETKDVEQENTEDNG